ncbi:MAG TPA: prolyl oligopeptidase family serine peptidase [Streptosporangiaceae bacterium]|nr:prolyl oligopeptidase family serine peptidase [Streptosporangiaceae bacterium]
MPGAADRPPVAPGRPASPGADPYAWLRDSDDPATREYLAAERAYYDRQAAATTPLRDRLAAELESRTAPAGDSVSWQQGAFRYFTRDLAGQDYPQLCRVPLAAGAAGAQVLLDENLLLADPGCRGGYVALGEREISPDGRLLAYSVDFDGDEQYQLRVRDLDRGQDLVTAAGLPERIDGSYYGLAWSAGSDAVFYTVTDAACRPYRVWRHDIGTDRARDALVYQEDDQRFGVTVRATRSGECILIECASRDTTETLVIPAAEPGTKPFALRKRSSGTAYLADHARGTGGGEFFLITNDGAAEFRLLRGPAAGSGRWTEVIAGGGDTRLVRCDVFGRHLVVSQRRAAATQLRVIDRQAGTERLIAPPGPEVSLALAENREYDPAAVTVRTESVIDPPAWHDVDLATGRWTLRKRQPVPGYDPAGYRTERITATAADGTPVPVTVAYRAGFRRDGTAPCLLYGYGAYESCSWPRFATGVVSLLDRGYLYAIAHVRGGGEGGRSWWQKGRLDRKRTTFTDFIAVADDLAEAGWAAGHRIASRGRSAGGLLQGAVFSMAPQRWRAVVAEVPFVDVLTTMLDPGIPLTITEWDEWGDPRDPRLRAYLASYSPYENIPPPPWPRLLVTGSLQDPRVLIHEPAKWVAKLRAAGGGPVLFRPELGAGAHAGPAGRYGKLGYEAEVLAFVIGACGEGVPDGTG